MHTLIKLLDRVVSGVRFLTGGVLECDISHFRPVAVLCILYKVRCHPMHPLYDALPMLYVPVRLHEVLWSLYLSVPQDLYSLLGILVERSCRPYIR